MMEYFLLLLAYLATFLEEDRQDKLFELLEKDYGIVAPPNTPDNRSISSEEDIFEWIQMDEVECTSVDHAEAPM